MTNLKRKTAPELFQEGQRWMREKVDQAALECLEQALALKPDYPDALTVLAYIAFKQQEYQQAEEILRRIIADEDDNGLAHCLLGQALEARGQIEQAEACYRRALEIDPQDRLAQKLTSEIENTRIGEKATHDKL